MADLGSAIWAAASRPSASYRWGAGLILHASLDPVGRVVAILVPAVAAVVVGYAAAHEDRVGLERLVGLLVAFVGSMELLVVASDLLTLLIGWELVGALSWALISHEWRDADRPASAAHAFNATRFGDLGLFLAAGAALAGVGSFDYAALGRLQGGWLDLLVAGIVLAAAAKSAQLPFSPWLFSAMAGPTSVSALLHAATMVAAGAYILSRLQPVLSQASWFGPAVMALGLTTALAVAVAHLVTHAAFKALLFLAAGLAQVAVGSLLLDRMRLGRALPAIAALAAVGSLALAGVPPMGAAWTKDHIVSAAGTHGVWLAALVAVAGGLSAFYATRFQLLAFGDGAVDRTLLARPGPVELAAVGVLAAASVAAGALWLPGARGLVARLAGTPVPLEAAWELAVSLAAVGIGIAGGAAAVRRPALARRRWVATAAEWLGLPLATRTIVVDPTLTLCRALVRFDDRVIDAGVSATAALGRGASRLLSWRGELSFDGMVAAVARLIGAGGRTVRKIQTGRTQQYYLIIAAGLVVVVVVAVLGR
jgi:NADH:ubiquinone oxidoreductase subunit 5 (subunit L)/multisubunit Na+/H+ antiporter MnhA subunit